MEAGQVRERVHMTGMDGAWMGHEGVKLTPGGVKLMPKSYNQVVAERVLLRLE